MSDGETPCIVCGNTKMDVVSMRREPNHIIVNALCRGCGERYSFRYVLCETSYEGDL
jgi:hypothetical protein